jgi:hypothetical protein
MLKELTSIFHGDMMNCVDNRQVLQPCCGKGAGVAGATHGPYVVSHGPFQLALLICSGQLHRRAVDPPISSNPSSVVSQEPRPPIAHAASPIPKPSIPQPSRPSQGRLPRAFTAVSTCTPL